MEVVTLLVQLHRNVEFESKLSGCRRAPRYEHLSSRLKQVNFTEPTPQENGSDCLIVKNVRKILRLGLESCRCLRR